MPKRTPTAPRPARVEVQPAKTTDLVRARPDFLRHLKLLVLGFLTAITLLLAGWLTLTFSARHQHFGGKCSSAQVRGGYRWHYWSATLGGREFRWPTSTGVRARDLVGHRVEGRYWKSPFTGDEILSVSIDGKTVLDLDRSLWWLRFWSYASFAGAFVSIAVPMFARPKKWD